MYTGFITRFRPKNTPLTERDIRGQMWKEPNDDLKANDHLACIAFNSTYIEFIDRWFKIRGSIRTFVSFIMLFFFLWATWGVIYFASVAGYYVLNSLLGLLTVAMIAFLFYFLFLRECFTYTHWPIRFNRKNRMVYVFRHNGPNGVLRVPFDDIFFHLGHSRNKDRPWKDLRGEIGDGKIVTDTFAVGNYIGDQVAVAELWEFILRYMARGPEGLDFKRIDASVDTRWLNCFTYSGGRIGSTLTRIFLPLVLITTATRWLVMKSCKTPVWPADVEAECAIDPDDPYDLPQPSYVGEFDD